MTKDQTAGQRIIASAKNALAFARGEENGCIVHIPDGVDVGRIRKKMNGKNLSHHGKAGRPD